MNQLFNTPQLAHIREQFESGNLNEWEAFAALLRASVGVLTSVEHDRSPVGRMAWAAQMAGALVRERDEGE